MSCLNDNVNATDCPAADPDFDFSSYLNTCRVCIAGNPDVAGLGIITGIILQAGLMNVFVLLWWGAGPGLHGIRNDLVNVCRWCMGATGVLLRRPGTIWDHMKETRALLRKDFDRFGERIRAVAQENNSHAESVPDGVPGAVDGADNLPVEHSDVKGVVAADPPTGNNENMSSSHRKRKILQKTFRTFSDTQAVTGIALLLAALIQGDCLSLYHTGILITLISISADGQAIMLFYAYRNFDADTPFAPLRADRGIRLRLLSSAFFLVLYFVFVFKGYFRYRDSEECFLLTVDGRNSGTWGIATAILVLVVYFPIFLPRKWHEWCIKSGRTFTSYILAFLYSTDLDGPANLERSLVSKKDFKGRALAIFFGLRRILAWMIYAIGKVVIWLFHRELVFPLATWIYFIWNVVVLGRLKRTNAVLLAGGGEEEKNFGAFGQIVPIVMGATLAFPIYDVLQEPEVP